LVDCEPTPGGGGGGAGSVEAASPAEVRNTWRQHITIITGMRAVMRLYV
jgi:hypothetical protein